MQNIIGSEKFSREFHTSYDSLGPKDSFYSSRGVNGVRSYYVCSHKYQ